MNGATGTAAQGRKSVEKYYFKFISSSVRHKLDAVKSA